MIGVSKSPDTARILSCSTRTPVRRLFATENDIRLFARRSPLHVFRLTFHDPTCAQSALHIIICQPCPTVSRDFLLLTTRLPLETRAIHGKRLPKSKRALVNAGHAQHISMLTFDAYNSACGDQMNSATNMGDEKLINSIGR
jgi:hypothetical protein